MRVLGLRCVDVLPPVAPDVKDDGCAQFCQDFEERDDAKAVDLPEVEYIWIGCGNCPAQFFRVVLPAALPSIFTGIRLGLGFAWVVIVVGEMTGVQTGLGALIMDARQLSRTDIVISGMIVIGIVGFLSDRLAMLIGKRLLAWSPSHG